MHTYHPTIPLRVAPSSQARLHVSGSGLGWPSPLSGSHYPTSLSSLVPFTKSSSGRWRILTFVAVSASPTPLWLLLMMFWHMFPGAPHASRAHAALLGWFHQNPLTWLKIREKKSPYYPPRDTGRSPETWQLCQRNPPSTICLKPGLGWRAPACWTCFPVSQHALLRTGGACAYCAVARLQGPAGSPSQADIYHPLRIGLEYWQRNEQQQQKLWVFLV